MSKWQPYVEMIAAWKADALTDMEIADLLGLEIGQSVTREMVTYIRKQFGIKSIAIKGKYKRKPKPAPVCNEFVLRTEFVDGVRITYYKTLWADGARRW